MEWGLLGLQHYLEIGEWRESFIDILLSPPETLRNGFPGSIKEGRTLIFLGLVWKQEVDPGVWKEPF